MKNTGSDYYLQYIEKHLKIPRDMTEDATLNAIQMIKAIDMELNGITLDFSCFMGCSHCCGLNIDTSMHERMLIVHFLPTLDDEIFNTAGENIKKWEQQYARLHTKFSPKDTQEKRLKFIEDYESNNISCPFLLNNECIIYPVRPVSCRTYFSVSPPEMCKTRDRSMIRPGYAEEIRYKSLSVLVNLDEKIFKSLQTMPLGLYFSKKFSQINQLRASIKKRAQTTPQMERPELPAPQPSFDYFPISAEKYKLLWPVYCFLDVCFIKNNNFPIDMLHGKF